MRERLKRAKKSLKLLKRRIQKSAEAKSKVRQTVFRGIIPYLSYSEALQLRFLDRETNKFLEILQPKLSFKNPLLTYKKTNEIESKFEQIKELELPHIFTQNDIVIQNQQNITKLTVKYLPLTKEQFEIFISKFIHLESLTVYYNKYITKPDPEIYNQLQIKELNLDKVDLLTDFQIVGVNQQLNSLSFKCDIRLDKCKLFQQLENVPQLLKLRIAYIGVPLNETFIESFRQLLNYQNQLETFELELIGLSDQNRKELLEITAQQKSIQSLKIGIKRLGLISIKFLEIFELQISRQLEYLLFDINFDSETEIKNHKVMYMQPKILDVSSLVYDELAGTHKYLQDIIKAFNKCSIYIHKDQPITRETVRKVQSLKTVM